VSSRKLPDEVFIPPARRSQLFQLSLTPKRLLEFLETCATMRLQFLIVRHFALLKIGEGEIMGSDLSKEARNADICEQLIRWSANFFEQSQLQ
jgi:hypothetical protein